MRVRSEAKQPEVRPPTAHQAAAVAPPVAKQVAHTWHRACGEVEDPWAWLRDRDDPDVLAYLQAENAYADAWFDRVAGLRRTIFGEIRSRTEETDLSVPVRKGPWWYVTRTEEGLAYGIHCRGGSAEAAAEQVLLDENAEAEGHDFFEVGAFDVSPDHRVLAWSADATGAERFTLRFRDLDTGADLPDVVEGTYYSTAWSADAAWLFYTVPDETMRPWQVWRHRLGTSQPNDVLVLEEDDDRFFLSVELTRSERWIVLTAESNTTTEVRVVPADEPTARPHLVRGRQQDHEYRVDDAGGHFVILTNLDAEDFRVVTARHDAPGEWDDLVPHVAGRRIAGVDAFAGHLALHEWSAGTPRLRVLLPDGTDRVLPFAEEVHGVTLAANPEFDTTTLRFDYQSLTTPASVFDEDLATGERGLLKQTPVLDVDLTRYRSAREWATSPDGTQVPVDVVWRDGTPLDGTAPLVLHGYGSYEASVPPWFSIARLSLLDRGVVWALAHPRGGGELGRRWYLDGKLERKVNTFTDFLTCADHLVQRAYGASDRVAIHGGSAGGLLVGACATMRPERFRAVVAEVPFVDVVTTMLDTSLPLTATEWEEWGDPADPDVCARMAAYSPYDNVRPVAYPAMYVTAGLNDPRVGFHEPAKWVAKMRATGTGDEPLLLRTELGAGHAGRSGRYDAWEDAARLLAFLLTALGVGEAAG